MSEGREVEMAVESANAEVEQQLNEADMKALVGVIYKQAAAKLMAEEDSANIIKEFVDKGIPIELASQIVHKAEDDIDEHVKKQGRRNMLFGALWCIGGTLITIITYNAASNGGRYVVAWGAIIFGAVQFFRGVMQSSGR